MPEYDTVLFHGSCVAVDGAGYLFTAKSGTGKSTHTRLWRELLGSRAVMVNDDKPLIHVPPVILSEAERSRRISSETVGFFTYAQNDTERRPLAYGTPWDGKHRLSSNIFVPLKAICILKRAAENRIEPIPAREAYHMLLQQVYRPADPTALAKTLVLLDRLAAAVKLYRLGCNMQPEAARLSYETMR